MLLAAALAVAIHAQAAASAKKIDPSSDGYLTSSPPIPEVWANSPHACADGTKLQRYHEPMHATFDNIPPSGWVDVDPAQPHEGDYRCVRVKPQQAAVSMCGPEGNEPCQPSGGETVITHEPYDGLGTAFPPNPSPRQTFKDSSGNSFTWLDGHWWPEPHWSPLSTGMRDCPSDQHYHPAQMPKGVPDIYGGPAPVADGRCHLNLGDEAVLPHGKKLEAKR